MLQVLAQSFRNYPIWAYIQPQDQRRIKLLAWVLKRYIRALLTKSGRKRGYAFAVKETPSEQLLGVVLLWRPSIAGRPLSASLPVKRGQYRALTGKPIGLRFLC